LAARLQAALSAHPLDIRAPEAPEAGHDLVLLLGLPSAPTPPETRQHQIQADSALRAQLHALGLAFRVVYGDGAVQLDNALLALGLTPDEAARVQREQAQFGLNRGRTPWTCEQCSDPACEHRLFTGLMARR
jgi:hypothetical protein